MGKSIPIILFFLIFINRPGCHGQVTEDQKSAVFYQEELRAYQDSQVLYNGRIWQKRNRNVYGNEFLFTALWLKGDVMINNHQYRDKSLRYDILNDELLIRRPDGVVISLNKEMISGFNLTFDNVQYRFDNFGNIDNNVLRGFANVLYEGKTVLLLKSVKEIIPLGYKKVYDIFGLTEYLYVMKSDNAHRLRGRKGLLDFLNDRRNEVKRFIRDNKIIILPRHSASVIPVLEFYDNLTE